MIAIIGGGISGLTLAYELQKKGILYKLFEGSDNVGGVIRSEKVKNYTLDYGPNSLLCGKEVRELLSELGLDNDLIEAKPVSKARYIVKKNKVSKLPSSPLSLLLGNFFTWKTKRKIFNERKYKIQDSPKEESLTSLIERHFGEEVVEYALKPFMAGIYAGNPDELSATHSFPKLKEYEKMYGSILKGFIKNSNGERRKTVSFKGGMHQLPQTIASKLKAVQTNKAVQSMVKSTSGIALTFEDDEVEIFEKVVICSGTKPSVELLDDHNHQLAMAVEALPVPTMAVVHNVFKKKDIKHPLNGFGALNAPKAGLFSAGTIWSSSVFSDKTPAGETLLTTFVGGRQYPSVSHLEESVIENRVLKELNKLFSIKGEPVFSQVHKIDYTIPQYTKEIRYVKQQAELLEKDNIFVCSNWVNGVSLEDCIKGAIQLANRITL